MTIKSGDTKNQNLRSGSLQVKKTRPPLPTPAINWKSRYLCCNAESLEMESNLPCRAQLDRFMFQVNVKFQRPPRLVATWAGTTGEESAPS